MNDFSNRDIPNIIRLLRSGLINGSGLASKTGQINLFQQSTNLLPGEQVLGNWMANFPVKIRELSSSPIVIFLCRMSYIRLKGFLVLGIAGSRIIDDSDKSIMSQFFREISLYRDGVVIITGGASGVDSYCINKCIQHQIRQIIIRPVFSRNLIDMSDQEKMVILVSIYPSGTKVEKRMFLERNSVIAALCDSLIVFRAGEHSGSVNTANSAIKLGRKIFVYGEYEFGDGRYLGNEDLLEKGCRDLAEFKRFLDNYYKSV